VVISPVEEDGPAACCWSRTSSCVGIAGVVGVIVEVVAGFTRGGRMGIDIELVSISSSIVLLLLRLRPTSRGCTLAFLPAVSSSLNDELAPACVLELAW